jgi:hypothetical protein
MSYKDSAQIGNLDRKLPGDFTNVSPCCHGKIFGRSWTETMMAATKMVDTPMVAAKAAGGPRRPNAARALCEESLYD